VSRTDAIDGIAQAVARRLGDPAFLDLIAEAIAERLVEQLDLEPKPERRLMDASKAAKFLGVDRPTIYSMVKAGRLPVIKLGDSARPRLRFDFDALAEHLAATPCESPRSSGRRRSRSFPSGDLLPIRGAESE
jgi:excisionase family DNA binding protein